MARLAVLLSLPQPPTRQTLLKDAVRFGVVSAATEPLQDLHKWLELEFHPLVLCKRVETTLKAIEDDNDEKSQLQQYMPAIREITLVRLLKQVSQVYQSICFKRLLDLAPFATSFELERVIVDCVRHNDMQVRVDHRTRTVHFGTELAEAQSITEAEGPHLQDMPSEQIRTQLMLMHEVLYKSLKMIHPDQMKIDNNKLRQKIIEAYHQSKNRDHQRILERQKSIEERKEYLEQLSISRTEEEQKKLETALLEKQKQEKARLDLERDVREKAMAKERLAEIQQQHVKEKLQQIMQTEIGKRVMQKLDEKALAELDTNQINMKQEEEFENEKRMFIAKLKAQEKTMDHMERGKRKEEIPLLKEAITKDLKDDTLVWNQKEMDRIANAIKERKEDESHRDRLARMREDKDNFMVTLLTQRKAQFETKLSQHNELVKEQRAVRLEERKTQRREERKQKYSREKEEEEQRRKDEELKRIKEEKEQEEADRIAREEEAYRKKMEELDRQAEKQKEREKEIEEKQKRAKDEGREKGIWRSSRVRDELSKDEGGLKWRQESWEKSPIKGQDDKRAPPGGGWKEREQRKIDQWGPPRDKDNRDDDKRGERDRDVGRYLTPRRVADEGEWRRADNKCDRDSGNRAEKDRNFGQGGTPRRGAEEGEWKRDERKHDRDGDSRGERARVLGWSGVQRRGADEGEWRGVDKKDDKEGDKRRERDRDFGRDWASRRNPDEEKKHVERDRGLGLEGPPRRSADEGVWRRGERKDDRDGDKRGETDRNLGREGTPRRNADEGGWRRMERKDDRDNDKRWGRDRDLAPEGTPSCNADEGEWTRVDRNDRSRAARAETDREASDWRAPGPRPSTGRQT